MVKLRHSEIGHRSAFGSDIAKIPSGESKNKAGGDCARVLVVWDTGIWGSGVQVGSPVGFKSLVVYKACLSSWGTPTCWTIVLIGQLDPASSLSAH